MQHTHGSLPICKDEYVQNSRERKHQRELSRVSLQTCNVNKQKKKHYQEFAQMKGPCQQWCLYFKGRTQEGRWKSSRLQAFSAFITVLGWEGPWPEVIQVGGSLVSLSASPGLNGWDPYPIHRESKTGWGLFQTSQMCQTSAFSKAEKQNTNPKDKLSMTFRKKMLLRLKTIRRMTYCKLPLQALGLAASWLRSQDSVNLKLHHLLVIKPWPSY